LAIEFFHIVPSMGDGGKSKGYRRLYYAKIIEVVMDEFCRTHPHCRARSGE
jgi:hypothetical protein